MSFTTCIAHPANERLVIIRQWQLEFCDGNHGAAAVLSFFEYWHNWKLNSDNYNRKQNNIAEMHGEPRSLNEDIFQYHSYNEISDGILNLYGAKTIGEKTIKILVAKKALSIHANPHPKHHYDKTQYFSFNPDVCNEWLKTSYKQGCGVSAETEEISENRDTVKYPSRRGNNSPLNGKKSVYKGTEINNKEINKLNTPGDDFLDDDLEEIGSHTASTQLSQLIKKLVQKGMPVERLIGHQDLPLLAQLITDGAPEAVLLKAYDVSLAATSASGKQFGLRYLIKVAKDLIKKSSQPVVANKKENTAPQPEQVYENDVSRGLAWMGDLAN